MRLGGILLAAGASARFGPDNKLLAEIDGVPMIRRTAAALIESELDEIVAVTGADAHRVERALSGLGMRIVHNPDWQSGMGTSIAAGIEALSPGLDGAFIVPADMPFLPVSLLQRLADAFAASGAEAIVFPITAEGEQRNPVLWPARCFVALKHLHGVAGGKALLNKALLKENGDACKPVPIKPGEDVADIDTQQALQKTLPQ